LVELVELPVRIAEEEGVALVVETGNNAMMTSAYLGRRLIDDLGTDHLKLLWDPAIASTTMSSPTRTGTMHSKADILGTSSLRIL
jgi:sugar phosphate isomerase/epimerase